MSHAAVRALSYDPVPAIPVCAAGRDPLFLFGTLMDRDVLSRALDRPTDPDDLRLGTLAGFRRVRVMGRSYPMLVPDQSASVHGWLFDTHTPRDIRRINHFESGEYHAGRRAVQDPAGVGHEAWLYVAREELLPSEAPWALATWVTVPRADFLVACDRWMAESLE